jgi:hypothetical protein
MAREFYVNGEASVASGTGGGGALEEMGISVDGVSITINEYNDGIMIDTRGPHVPGEYQYFLNDADIKMELVYFDEAVVEKWLSGTPGIPNSYLEWDDAGQLLFLTGRAARLLIRSTPFGTGLTGQADCYNFPLAILTGAAETKLGTVRSTWTLTFKAMPAYQPCSTFGQIVLDDNCS